MAETPHVDGRVARGQRARDAIVEAWLGLVAAGNLRPTTAQLAKAAGVSERTVFHHFAALELLLETAKARQLERLKPELEMVVRPGSFEKRLAEFVAHRARLYEMIFHTRRAALLYEPFSPAVASGLVWVRDIKRVQVGAAFEQELTRFSPVKRRIAEAALGAAASWSTWEGLRRHQGLSIAQAKRALAHLIAGALGRKGR
jgi:AcrR family transcriptional regulator